MKRVGFDFAPPSLALGLARVSLFAWLVGIGAVIAIACAGRQLRLMKQERELVSMQGQNAQRHLRRATSVEAPRRPPIPDPQVDAVNQAVGQLNLPWRDLFDAIDTSTPANIALLSITPDARKQLVRGVAEAASSAAMLDYIRTLKRHPFFSEAVLTRHEVNDKDPNRPIRFQFDVIWRTEQ